MAAYHDELTPEEDQLCALITKQVAELFCQGHEMIESETIVDRRRKMAFFMVVSVFPFENQLNEFDDTAFETVMALNQNISDIYLKVEITTNSYAVIVDVARQGINQRDHEPLEKEPSFKKVDPVADEMFENIWDPTRENFYTDNQASFGLCVATNITNQFCDWFGSSNIKEYPRVDYRKVLDDGREVNVYTHAKYSAFASYQISNSILKTIKRISPENSMIKSISFIIEISKKTGEHRLTVVVLVADVPETVTGFYPRYKAPKRVSIREPPVVESAADNAAAKSASARRRKKAAMRARS